MINTIKLTLCYYVEKENMNKKLFMLWHYNSKNDLSNEVRKALEHYKQKYGNPPQIVLFNDKVEIPELDVECQKKSFVLANHILVGDQTK